MIRREGNKVWLDLDVFYPPPGTQPNTVFKSMAIAFQACGSTTTYTDLMGISAAAFRLQVSRDLCPSSPHPHLGFSCTALARKSLRFELCEHAWDSRDPAALEKASQAVVLSIDSGRPVLTEDEESGLAVGYIDSGRNLLVRDPYSGKGDIPSVLGKKWPGWGMTTIVNLPSALGREAVIESLSTAVKLARTEELLGNGYASGFAAFELWIAELRDPALTRGRKSDVGARLLGNAHIYCCLVDARLRAVEYLPESAALFTSEISKRLQLAADHYARLAQELDAGWNNVPWPQQVKKNSEWTADHRAGQAASLERALELERLAVAEIEEALASLG